MKRITDLRTDIATKEARMKAIFDACEKENRARTEAETTEWRTLKGEVDAAKAELADLEDQQIRNAATATHVPAPTVHNRTGNVSEKELKDFSGFKLLRGLALLAEGKPLDGVEADVHAFAVEEARKSGLSIQGFGVPAEITKRGQTATGQTTNPGDQGGVTIQTEVNGLIEALWSKNFLSEVGATRLNGLIGNQTFPVQDSKPAASERTEIEELADTEILFSEISMSPNRRGVTIPVSKQLLIQSSIDVQAFVINQIRKALDYKLNVDSITAILAAITSGNNNLLELGTNGAAPTYADIVGLETLLASVDADKGAVKYLTNTKVRGKMKLTEKFSGTNGNPVWENGNIMNGYSTAVSNVIPSNLTKGTASGICSAIVFGNFQDFYVGMWGGVDFVVDPYTLAKKHSVQITANMFWDTEVARAASFTGIKDALTA